MLLHAPRPYCGALRVYGEEAKMSEEKQTEVRLTTVREKLAELVGIDAA